VVVHDQQPDHPAPGPVQAWSNVLSIAAPVPAAIVMAMFVTAMFTVAARWLPHC